MQNERARARGVLSPTLILTAAVVIVLATKILAFFFFWRQPIGDFGRLVGFADIILSSSSWVYDSGINREALPPEIWKTPGYPLLLVAAKLLLKDSWHVGIIILNAALSLMAGFFVRRLALCLGFDHLLAAIAFVLYEFSVPASTDMLIMPDGLYGSLTTMVLCHIGAQIAVGKQPSISAMAGAGGVILLCFFIREGFVYLFIPVALSLIIPARLNGLPAMRAAVLLVVFCAPTLLGAGAMLAWNRYRTGEYIIAVVNQTVFLTAILKVAEKDRTVFSGDTPLDRTARATFSDFDYGDAQHIDVGMFQQYGIKAPEMARLTKDKYWQTVFEHPAAYLRSVGDRFRFRQQASMIGDILMRMDDLEFWQQMYGHNYYGGWREQTEKFIKSRDWRDLNLTVLAQAVPRLIARAITIVLFLLFVFGLPILVVRDLRRAATKERAAAALLAAFEAVRPS